MSNQKPIVVVTGSSAGIGLELCLQLARQNYVVVATLRTPSAAPSTLQESPCDVQPLDVTCEESVADLTSYLRSTYGGCDVLINNAGRGMPGTLETCLIEEAKRVFDVNVWGVMRMCQFILPLMRERGGGLIVTISSTSAWRGCPGLDVYTGSKFAIEGMMEGFRYSVLKDNIKVCMVNPGPTATGFVNRFEKEYARGTRLNEIPTLIQLWVQSSIDKLEKRVSSGQSATDCAAAITAIIARELPKNVSDGTEFATFCNPTSEFGEHVLKNTKVVGDGHSGLLFPPIFQDSYASLDMLQKQTEK